MRYLFVVAFAAIALTAFLKPLSVSIHGKITDDRGQALVGVSISEKGTRNTVASDAAGEFTITVKDEHSVLVFSSIGFETKEVKIKGRDKLTISLKPSTLRLEEVVTTGLNLKKDEVEYDVRSLSTSGYGNHISAAGKMLAGRVSGVNVQRGRVRSGSSSPRLSDTLASVNFNTEDYDNIVENRFLDVRQNALSTFSIDVDAASYANVRRFLEQGQQPPAGAVRMEELINYFHYDYPQPAGNDPFSINTEIAVCPWSPTHRLVSIGLQGKNIPTENLPMSNLVFLIDVSGSMMEPNKLPLVQSAMKMLVDQLRPKDKVSLVTYAGNAGLVLPATAGDKKTTIKDAIDRLEAGGSTAGGAGIQLAYKVAIDNFVKGGNNRVILCTDGDFNVGASSDDDLVRLIEQKRQSGVFLTVLGFGMGNYKDNKIEKLADKGNGNHAYIDGLSEARKVLVNEFGGTMFTIAKDVKLQVEFNPSKVQAYRLIGYENRMLNKEDFNNDKKDAGEMGSGHTVTALYEIIPVGVKNDFAEPVDALKYQQETRATAGGDELMNIKVRYKQPDGDKSSLLERPVMNSGQPIANASANLRFAAAVAEFGLVLRSSEFKQQASLDNAWALAKDALGPDAEGYRSGFLTLIRDAQAIARNKKTDDGKLVSVRE